MIAGRAITQMPTCNGSSIIHTDLSHVAPTPPLPPWLSHSNSNSNTSPSVILSLSTSTTIDTTTTTTTTTPECPWPQCSSAHVSTEILRCYNDLDESHRALEAHKKEAAWRLRRVQLLLESEKASRKRQKVEEIEARIKAIKCEEKVSLERIEMEYREQLAELTLDSEAKEHKLTEQWASKHLRLTKCLQRVNNGSRLPEPNARRQ